MEKRLFDIIASLAAMILLCPLFLFAAIGIRLFSQGPILYRAERAGLNGTAFVMHKFRTMCVAQGSGASRITSSADSRVFWFGALLRRLKIDELPQLYDVLRGAMSVVGPRPEDATIIRDHYSPEQMETLSVRPGLASPGSIYNYTHGEKLIGKEHPEQDYCEKLLPVKLAVDLIYVREATFLYDLSIIFRTLWVILLIGLGKQYFPDPPEMGRAKQLLDTWGGFCGKPKSANCRN